jgi:hypothetical protein
MTDLLGKTRDLGQGSHGRSEQFIYGLHSAHPMRGKPQPSAAEVIRGNYADSDQYPDDDLGKSMTPGFRNSTQQVKYDYLLLHCIVVSTLRL